MDITSRRGQSIGEYAVLIGLVLAAAVAVSPVIRNRIQAAIEARGATYTAVAGGAGATGTPGITMSDNSESEGTQDMTRAGLGTLRSRSGSTSDSTY